MGRNNRNNNNNRGGGTRGNSNRGGYQGNNNRGGHQGSNNNKEAGMSSNGSGVFWKDTTSRERVKKILSDHGYNDFGQALDGGAVGDNGQARSYASVYWSAHWKTHYETEFAQYKADYDRRRAENGSDRRTFSSSGDTIINDDGDDFLERLIHKAELMNYHPDNLLAEGEREQDAILRYQFRSAAPIDVSANLVNGRFKIANAWGSLSQQNSLLAHAAHYFYSRNIFRIETVEDFKSFTQNLPESSRTSTRHLMLMSRVIRRKPQRSHMNDRTKEDMEVSNCIAQYPNLQQLTFVLGWDISDPAHRSIMGEWAQRSKYCVQINVYRSDAQTLVPGMLTALAARSEAATDQLEISLINERLLSKVKNSFKMEM